MSDKKYTKWPEDAEPEKWLQENYSEVEQSVFDNLEEAVGTDTALDLMNEYSDMIKQVEEGVDDEE